MASLRESYDDYPEVLAIWDRWRLIVSADTRPATQWIMQRQHGAGRWLGVLHFQTRTALRRYAAWKAADPATLAIIDALPERCPQRHEKGPSEPQSEMAGVGIPD